MIDLAGSRRIAARRRCASLALIVAAVHSSVATYTAVVAEPISSTESTNRRSPNLSDALRVPHNAVRIATYNVALAGQREGEMLDRLRGGTDAQARAVAEIIQRVRPHVILINELDYTPQGELLNEFVERYLTVGQNCCNLPTGASPGIKYPHRYSAGVNTGLASGFDLNRDGKVGAEPDTPAYADDAWGYGRYPGQYGMAVLSQLPLQVERIRAFQQLRWRDMPRALLPEVPSSGGASWYTKPSLEQFPLSSKSHWDVPVVVHGRAIHLLASHPTPPVFDGPEDRNGRRNFDEIRFWDDYLSADKCNYIIDDQRRRGGLGEPARFVILGDLNSDPADGDDPRFPIRQLLDHPLILADVIPRSPGGREQAESQAGANASHRGDPSADTSDLVDSDGPGNLRLDYVLPSRSLKVVGGGVFWPSSNDPRFPLVGDGTRIVSSDHRLVWIDVVVDEESKKAH